jgi:chloramphenicol-sensitive protein RarD
MSPAPSEARTGLLAAVGAYAIWGLLPLYLKLLTGVPAADVLSHRILWSLLVVGLLLAFTKGLPRLRAALAQPRLMGLLFLSAVAIAANWLIYTAAILDGHVLDTSLGYFINPLINVLFGVVLLKERLSRPQWVAVAFALAGVAVLTIARGGLPLISLGVAVSFAIYALIRKQAVVDAATGLFLETLLLTPFALIWLATLPELPWSWPTPTLGLLAAAGIITATPLMLFSVAARRLKLTTLGLMQYATPTIVMLEAIFIFKEALDPARLAAFILIWAGLAVYTASMLRRPMASTGNSR